MNDAMKMRMIQCFSDLRPDSDHQVERQAAPRHATPQFSQRPALNILGDENRMAALLYQIMHSNDVRVVAKLRKRARLVVQSGDVSLV